MSEAPLDLGAWAQGEAQALLSACTGCARCVEVCPVLPFGSAAGQPPAEVVDGVLRLLAHGERPPASSADWLHACNGCGDCIAACPEHINPRRLLMLAAMRDAGIESRTPQLFRRMARAIKLMIAMQVVPEGYARLFTPSRPRPAQMIFYTGCNALRTPNLLFNTMAVLDALEVDYEVAGGPSACCGVIAAKWEGLPQVGGRVSSNTLQRFGQHTPERVLNWCPTCEVHLGETLAGFAPRSFEFDHVTTYLVSRSDELRMRFTHPIRRRVVLHAHRGMPEVGRNVEALLRAIPGLELLETVLESSYTCGGSGCSKSPALQAQEHAHLVDRVRASGADTLVTLYHGCHMAFMGLEQTESFEVLNFTELLAQALGQSPHEDRLKNLRGLADWKAIVEEAQPWLQRNGIALDSAWLERHGAEIFAVAEFKGGLECLSTEAPASADRAPASKPPPSH
jgi:heterodisulfide reductase subunit D